MGSSTTFESNQSEAINGYDEYNVDRSSFGSTKGYSVTPDSMGTFPLISQLSNGGAISQSQADAITNGLYDNEMIGSYNYSNEQVAMAKHSLQQMIMAGRVKLI
ncbi:hypothetical protein [uncultured Endozoicomonas sp.]|uniref:hypothetical protein n=1 Tax=uncultured Endozoicomonas sp. TaxID=432652 RepID=UPI00261FCE3E|nr:hypothetical protein [uncultured Endozoicomonas sp.]